MIKSQSREWQELAVLAQAGDQRAYAELLRDITPSIRNFLAGRLANPDWADDIVQEVLISVHKSLHTYSPDKPFRPWLIAIISFRRTDYLRQHYRQRDHEKTSTDDLNFQKEHVTKPEHWGEYKDVEKELDKLPETQRKVFQMMKIEGYTAQEVAKETGMSVSTVKVSSHRTAQKLKKALGG